MTYTHTTRRDFLSSVGAGILASSFPGSDAPGAIEPEDRADARPTPQQLAWQEAELTMFLHFGVNTFTNREWGEGSENPRIFNPVDLDAHQWVSAAKNAGFNYLILTAKHHDGFCLWPSKFTDHCVTSSPWRGGKGDVVGEFTRACHDAKLKVGLYLSPWDRHERCYGDSPAYNQYYANQLTELLSNYGDVAEVWFDGANGEGSNGKKQVYDWRAFYSTIRRLQPKALIAISGPDIRWVGNEDGFAHETEWSVRDPDPVSHARIDRKVWWPAECDVSIRPGWFWHKNEDEKIKSLSHLMDIYFKSVGRNSNLLLNVPPNDRGLLSDPDVARLREFRTALDRTFMEDIARGAAVSGDSGQPGHEGRRVVDGRPDTYWQPDKSGAPYTLQIDLTKPRPFNLSVLEEYIADGQRVESYRIEIKGTDRWETVVEGTTIGHKKIDRFRRVADCVGVRLTTLKSRGRPQLRRFGMFGAPDF